MGALSQQSMENIVVVLTVEWPLQTWHRCWASKCHHVTRLQGQEVKGQSHSITWPIQVKL